MENIINREISEKYNVVPLNEKNNILNILSLKEDDEIKTYLEYLTGKRINFIVSDRKSIDDTRNEIYKNRYQYYLEKDINELEHDFECTEDSEQSPIIRIVDNIISLAIDLNASDIHFEGKDDNL